MENDRKSKFQSVGPLESFPLNQARIVQVGTQPVLVLRKGNEVLAFDDYCPHRGGPLSEGNITQETIQCPWHNALFELKTGICKQGPTQHRLKLRECRVSGDHILVEVL